MSQLGFFIFEEKFFLVSSLCCQVLMFMNTDSSSTQSTGKSLKISILKGRENPGMECLDDGPIITGIGNSAIASQKEASGTTPMRIRAKIH